MVDVSFIFVPAMSKKEAIKDKIGEAAMQVFGKFGLEKITLDDIAKAVGLNKASLYYYYKYKEDIFLEVALREGEAYINDLQQKVLHKKGVESKIVFYLQERIHYYMLVLDRSKVRTETLLKILPRFFELYNNVLQQEKDFLAQLLEEGIKKGEIGKVDTKKLAVSLISISDALKHNVEQQAMVQNKNAVDYTATVKELQFILNLLFKGLKTS